MQPNWCPDWGLHGQAAWLIVAVAQPCSWAAQQQRLLGVSFWIDAESVIGTSLRLHRRQCNAQRISTHMSMRYPCRRLRLPGQLSEPRAVLVPARQPLPSPPAASHEELNSCSLWPP